MFCSKCGKDNAEIAKFCAGCGNAMQSSVKNKDLSGGLSEEALSVDTKKNYKQSWIAIAVVIIIGIVGVGSLYLSNDLGDSTVERYSKTVEPKVKGLPDGFLLV